MNNLSNLPPGVTDQMIEEAQSSGDEEKSVMAPIRASSESQPTGQPPQRPNCYECKFRRDLPGDAHSSCAHPIVGDTDPFEGLMAIFASVGRVAPAISEKARELNITAKAVGIRRGWFNWPYNFDPVWLQTCDGFTPRKSVTGEQKGCNK